MAKKRSNSSHLMEDRAKVPDHNQGLIQEQDLDNNPQSIAEIEPELELASEEISKEISEQISEQESGLILERRTRGENGSRASKPEIHKNQSSKSNTTAKRPRKLIKPLGPEAFVETLKRLYLKFEKDDKEFCIASLRIPELGSILERSKNSPEHIELAEQLDRIGTHVLLQSLRQEDKVCFLRQGLYLVLLPATSRKNAEKAIERVVSRIAESTIRHKSMLSRPSVSSKVLSVLDLQQAVEKETIHDVAIGYATLLHLLGFRLEPKGPRGLIDYLEDNPSSESHDSPPMFKGSYETWRERYRGVNNGIAATREQFQSKALFEIRRKLILDTWNDNQEVDLRVITPFGLDVPMTAEAQADLLARLRTLQSLNHPVLTSTFDFYIAQDWRLYLVSHPVEGLPLSTCGESICPELSEYLSSREEKTLLNWLSQLIGALIAGHSLVPPLLPATLSRLKARLKPVNGEKLRLVLSDYDLEYLLVPYLASRNSSDDRERGNGSDSKGIKATRALLQEISVLFENMIASVQGEIFELEHRLLNLLREAAKPDSGSSSLYKTRSALKSLEHMFV